MKTIGKGIMIMDERVLRKVLGGLRGSAAWEAIQVVVDTELAGASGDLALPGVVENHGRLGAAAGAVAALGGLRERLRELVEEEERGDGNTDRQ